jgi:peptidyl-prolyl cis-trans isomerase C
MTRRVLPVAAVLAIALVVGLAWRPWAAEVPDDAVLVIGDRSVSVAELDRRNESLRALYGVQEPTSDAERDEFRRQAAKSMAIGIVLDRAADKASVEVPDEQVDLVFQSFLDAQFGGDRQAFLDALGNVGTSEVDVLDEIRRQLRLRMLLDEIDGEVEISGDELAAAFQERKAQLATPERRGVRNIVVATRAGADQVRRQLDAGSDVAPLARRVSIDAATRDKGGFLGEVTRDQLVPAVGNAVFGVSAGQPYGPVKGPQGWNVGVVTEVLPFEPATLGRVADDLRSTLEAEESQRRWSAWLVDQLRAADIEYADAYRPEDPYEVSTWPSGVPGEEAP